MNAALPLLLAVGIDGLLGEPPNVAHPVVWMGWLIARGRDWALPHRALGQFLRGGCVALAIPLGCACCAWGIVRGIELGSQRWTQHGALLSLVVTALLLKPLFAIRALGQAAFVLRDALVAADVVAARRALGSLCSRSADDLDPPALVAAAVESIAENASDSIVAPLMWLIVAGVPGVVFYRASNTLDAMIGYHGRFEWVGKVAARLDDVLNLIPARLTAILFLAVAPVAGGDVRGGATILLRDGGQTESPNAGRPMATMAGLLGLRLEKVGHYALGDALREPVAHDITRAWRIVWWSAYAWVGLSAALLAITGDLRG